MDAYSKTSHYRINEYGTTYRQVTPGDSSVVTVTFDSPYFGSTSSTFSGYRNPAWRSQIRHGVNATTPASGTQYSGQPTWMSCGQDLHYRTRSTPYTYTRRYYEIGGYVNPFNLFGAPNYVPSSNVTTSVTNRCISRFLSQIQSIQSSIEAGQDIGEYRETVESIHHPLKSMKTKLLSYFSSLTKAKNRYKRSAPSLAKALADTYLEFHFGVQPLVDDVAQVIADADRFRFVEYPVSASAHEKFQGASSTFTPFIGLWASTPSASQGIVSNGTYSVRYKGAVKSGCSASGRLGHVQALRLLPKDWLPTAWDLLPYSWIADYFANIGDILQALSFCFQDLTWGCKTIRTETVTKVSDFSLKSPFVPDPSIYVVVSDDRWAYGGSSTFSVKTFSRSALVSSDLIPRFHFRIPTGKYPYLNLAALLIGRARKLVPFFL